jgi:hypothetical protein
VSRVKPRNRRRDSAKLIRRRRSRSRCQARYLATLDVLEPPRERVEHPDVLLARLGLVEPTYSVGPRRLQLARVGRPEIEYVIVDGPEPGSCSGRAALAETLHRILDTWENARIEADESSISMTSMSSSSTTSSGEARPAGWGSGR